MRQRRPKGEGGISPIKDKEGKVVGYEGSIEIKGDLGGKRQRKKVRAATKTEVSQRLRELRKEQDQGVQIGTKRQTVAQYMADWLENVVKHRNSPSTYNDCERLPRLHIVPYIGHIRLDKLTQKHIEQLRDTLLSKPKMVGSSDPLKLSTVVYILNILKRALNKAVEDGLIATNVVSRVAIATPEFEVHALTEEQVRAFLHALEGDKSECLLSTSFFTGARRGEVLALTRDDIDLETKTITVNKSLGRIRGKRVLGKTKTKKPRTIAIPDVLIPLLEQQLALHNHDLVFPNRDGGHLDPMTMLNRFKAILHKADLPESITIHMLRHTFATLLLDAGENITNVAAQLGHSKVSTTLDVYASSVRASQAKGINELGDRLKKD